MKSDTGEIFVINPKYSKNELDIKKIAQVSGLNHDSLKNYFAKGRATHGVITDTLSSLGIIRKLKKEKKK